LTPAKPPRRRTPPHPRPKRARSSRAGRSERHDRPLKGSLPSHRARHDQRLGVRCGASLVQRRGLDDLEERSRQPVLTPPSSSNLDRLEADDNVRDIAANNDRANFEASLSKPLMTAALDTQGIQREFVDRLFSNGDMRKAVVRELAKLIWNNVNNPEVASA
jgi:hypothetical protein